MSLSPAPYLQLPPRMLLIFRVALLILWGVTFAAAHLLAFSLYFVPLLALMTFLLLPPFPVIVAALFLSAYLDAFPTDSIALSLKLLLTGAIWLAALITLSAKIAVRCRMMTAPPEQENRISDPEIPAALAIEPISNPSSDGTGSPHLRHNVITPLNLMLGFCEALLNPASASRQSLPAPFREDVKAIYRNGQQLKPLIESLVDQAASSQADKSSADPAAVQARKTVIVLDERGAAFELFRQYMPRYDVVRAASVEAIGRSRQEGDLLAVAISNDDYTLIPVVAQLVGDTVPILTFNLADAQSQMSFHGASDYLMKPVEFGALMAALERTGLSPRRILIVDDNRDNMQMLSRMLNSAPEPSELLKAYSGREALALLNEETPDVILLDFVLPDMDGLAMLNYLRTESRLARIPVLLVSAHRPVDILPTVGVTKLTLFRLAGFSPVNLARHIEAMLTAFSSET